MPFVQPVQLPAAQGIDLVKPLQAYYQGRAVRRNNELVQKQLETQDLANKTKQFNLQRLQRNAPIEDERVQNDFEFKQFLQKAQSDKILKDYSIDAILSLDPNDPQFAEKARKKGEVGLHLTEQRLGGLPEGYAERSRAITEEFIQNPENLKAIQDKLKDTKIEKVGSSLVKVDGDEVTELYTADKEDTNAPIKTEDYGGYKKEFYADGTVKKVDKTPTPKQEEKMPGIFWKREDNQPILREQYFSMPEEERPKVYKDQREAPVWYRYTEGGDLEAIPGGKADIEGKRIVKSINLGDETLIQYEDNTTETVDNKRILLTPQEKLIQARDRYEQGSETYDFINSAIKSAQSVNKNKIREEEFRNDLVQIFEVIDKGLSPDEAYAELKKLYPEKDQELKAVLIESAKLPVELQDELGAAVVEIQSGADPGDVFQKLATKYVNNKDAVNTIKKILLLPINLNELSFADIFKK